MKFYEGRKIEVHTTCNNCENDIVWAYLFPLNGENVGFLVTEENVLYAEVNILEERENEIKVSVSFRCRLCNHINECTGTIYKEDGKLMFRKQI